VLAWIGREIETGDLSLPGYHLTPI